MSEHFPGVPSMKFNPIPEPFRFPAYSAELEQAVARAPRETIRTIQSERLKHVVRYAGEKIPFYQDLWGRQGVDLRQIKTIDDLCKLPTWNVDYQRKNIEENPPWGNCYDPKIVDEIAMMLSTSGTTGTPRLFPVGYNDIPGMRDVMARCYHALGLNNQDLIQVTYTYAPMGAAWAFTWAAQGAGIGLLPASSGRTTDSNRQIDLIRRAGVTALAGTASFLLRLGEVAREANYDPAQWKVRKIIIAGELASAGVRAKLEDIWGAKVYDLFGSVDTLTWSSIDCEASRAQHGEIGAHIWEDACAIEVLDPEGNPVPEGEYGEMCITSWVWRSSPKIRFRSGDLIALRFDQCTCGRTLARMLPVRGRVDHVIRMRATSIYPMAIETAVLRESPTSAEWMAEAMIVGSEERLRITIESNEPSDQSFRLKVETSLRRALNLGAIDVVLCPPKGTSEFTGSGREPKVRRIFDRRHP
ncbi:MAG: AMP-binding protein [Acidobacteriaceae bacterium]|nr:AMP-binding protein [Acidobacteriaceae bacterium]